MRQGYKPLPKKGKGLYYDPLYGYVPLHPVVREALHLPTVQRLRDVKQLNTVEMVFTGATHNRLAHSVGVTHLASKVFDVLQYKYKHGPQAEERIERVSEDIPQLLPTHKLALQLAGLFHDVGHGPGSHAFETFCERHHDFREMNHTRLTKQLITVGVNGYDDIPEFLSSLYQKNEGTLPHAEILKPENIAALATGNKPPFNSEYTFLSQIIASDYDVDRMDYLRRDAYYTGVETGIVDIWELLHSFVMYPTKEGNTTIWNVGISESAAQSLETLLKTRDLTYRRVYYHPTHRTAQEMMIFGLCDVRDNVDPSDLALLTDSELLNCLSSDNIGTPFSKDIVEKLNRRDLYEPLPFEINVQQNLDDSARTQLSHLNKPRSRVEYEEFLDKLATLNEKLDLPDKYSIIFDLSRAPLMDQEALSEKYLYDEQAQERKSLFEIFPHLEMQYGNYTLPGQEEDISLAEKYRNHVSSLLIIVPVEFLWHCVSKIKRKLQSGGEQGDLSLGPEAKQDAATEVYEEKIEIIIKSFIEIIKLSEEEKKELLLNEFKSSTKRYLVKLLEHDIDSD